MQNANCGSCGAPIIWIRTAASGTYMPLNAEPDPERGNMVIVDGKAASITNDLFGPHVPAGAPKYLSHFATCPSAAKHRKRN